MGTTERVMRGWLGEHKSYRVLETIPCELSNRMETTNPERVMGNHRASQCGDRQGLCHDGAGSRLGGVPQRSVISPKAENSWSAEREMPYLVPATA